MQRRHDARRQKPARPGRGKVGSRAKRLGIAGVAILGVAVTAGPAQGALTATGTIDPLTNFPAWYEDADGTKLALCIDDPGCPSTQGAGVTPFTAPDGERFYQLASATATGPAGQSVTMDFNVEGAFLGDTAQDGITFGRMQVRMTGMEPNGVYTVTHPYGSGEWTAEPDGTLLGGKAAAQREETGCGNTPCDFDIALQTSIGPFLKWDPSESQPPAGYTGDGATPHTVLGSPTGDNFVRVEGPGLPAGGITTNLFTVEGKLVGDPKPIFFAPASSGAFGTVRAGTTVDRAIVIKNNGLADMDLGGIQITGADAAEFTAGSDGCANTTVASGATCSLTVSFTPATVGAGTANLVVAQSGGVPDHTIALTGTGGLPGLSTSPGIVNFLNQNVSTTSGEELLTVSNTGSVSMTVSAAALSGPQAGEFAVTSNTCATAIAPGATCKVGLRFLPAATGVRNATLTLTSDAAGGTHTVELTGNGTLSAGAGTSAPGAGAATGAVTGQGTAGATAALKPLVVKRLSMPRTIKRRTALKRGIRLHMELAQGTEVVRINVYRRSTGKLTLLSSGFKTPGKIGVYNVRQSHLGLRRLLRRGTYEVQVTPGRSRTGLGTTSKRAFKVV